MDRYSHCICGNCWYCGDVTDWMNPSETEFKIFVCEECEPEYQEEVKGAK